MKAIRDLFSTIHCFTSPPPSPSTSVIIATHAVAPSSIAATFTTVATIAAGPHCCLTRLLPQLLPVAPLPCVAAVALLSATAFPSFATEITLPHHPTNALFFLCQPRLSMSPPTAT
ncbi:hypothetical protein GW17_00015033 [Ensete ventricosum]|nr:hypothetical protein GW17_00015033 [Ensete ventricosum]RZR79677.1 hypothetical protein BHM03_00005468 [Ensete ventricosum]